jgi:hypothetical protein
MQAEEEGVNSTLPDSNLVTCGVRKQGEGGRDWGEGVDKDIFTMYSISSKYVIH